VPVILLSGFFQLVQYKHATDIMQTAVLIKILWYCRKHRSVCTAIDPQVTDASFRKWETDYRSHALFTHARWKEYKIWIESNYLPSYYNTIVRVVVANKQDSNRENNKERKKKWKKKHCADKKNVWKNCQVLSNISDV
jgi:hypothetical protein